MPEALIDGFHCTDLKAFSSVLEQAEHKSALLINIIQIAFSLLIRGLDFLIRSTNDFLAYSESSNQEGNSI